MNGVSEFGLRTSSLDTRKKRADEGSGLADTCEVGGLAAGRLQATNSAGESTLGDLVELARQNAGAGEGKGSGKSENGLHFD